MNVRLSIFLYAKGFRAYKAGYCRRLKTHLLSYRLISTVPSVPRLGRLARVSLILSYVKYTQQSIPYRTDHFMRKICLSYPTTLRYINFNLQSPQDSNDSRSNMYAVPVWVSYQSRTVTVPSISHRLKLCFPSGLLISFPCSCAKYSEERCASTPSS